jgi:hypothetical protein
LCRDDVDERQRDVHESTEEIHEHGVVVHGISCKLSEDSISQTENNHQTKRDEQSRALPQYKD